MTRKEWLRRFGEDWRAELPQRLGTLPANVTPLPSRIRHFASWAELFASYEPRPPAQVLAFAPPPRSPPAAAP